MLQSTKVERVPVQTITMRSDYIQMSTMKLSVMIDHFRGELEGESSNEEVGRSSLLRSLSTSRSRLEKEGVGDGTGEIAGLQFLR